LRLTLRQSLGCHLKEEKAYENSDACLYQAREFAERTGTTVRTLHHYDRLGLLRPTTYTAAGYRLYGESDFARLQQIVMLKFIGLSLKQIKELLNRSNLDLAATLRLQQAVIEEKRRQLEMVSRAIMRAEKTLAANDATDWEVFKKIIEEIDMENNMEWAKKYYTDEQLAELKGRWSPEIQEKAERDWAALIKEVEAAMSQGQDPTGETAQARGALVCADRRIHGRQSGHHGKSQKVYADWPSGVKSRTAKTWEHSSTRRWRQARRLKRARAAPHLRLFPVNLATLEKPKSVLAKISFRAYILGLACFPLRAKQVEGKRQAIARVACLLLSAHIFTKSKSRLGKQAN
jgi:DNA-binding transcriptional MerR regulator